MIIRAPQLDLVDRDNTKDEIVNEFELAPDFIDESLHADVIIFTNPHSGSKFYLLIFHNPK